MKGSKGNAAVILLYGPPGSGKGTQAKLLTDRFGFFHLDTGAYLRSILHDPARQHDPVVRRERLLNDTGKLNTPSWVLTLLKKRIAELARLKQSIVLSGSPRTLFEAIGDAARQGEIQLFERLYGKKNIFVFVLVVPEAETAKRNAKRLSCPVCRVSYLTHESRCPVCGAKMVRRRDDAKTVIVERLREYHTRTKPVFAALARRGYRFVRLDGMPPPYLIHKKIATYFES